MDQERDVLKEAQEKVLALRKSNEAPAKSEEEPAGNDKPNYPEREEKEKKGKKKYLLLLLLLLLLLVPGVFVLNWWAPWQSNDPFEMGFIVGSGTEGVLPGRSLEEMMADMQQIADENTISFRVNARPVFDDATSAGTIQIENPIYSVHFFRVNYYLVNALGGLGDLIYSTNMIAPNHHIDRDRLHAILPPGEHRAVAELTFYHFETFEQISVQQVELIITISG